MKQKRLRQVDGAAGSFLFTDMFAIRRIKTPALLQLFVYSPCGSSVQSGGAARALQPAGGRKMPHRVTADATSSHAPECDAGKVGLVPTVESGCEPLQTVREVQTSADERCRTRKKTHVYLKEVS